jgi:hypothetical protein
VEWLVQVEEASPQEQQQTTNAARKSRRTRINALIVVSMVTGKWQPGCVQRILLNSEEKNANAMVNVREKRSMRWTKQMEVRWSNHEGVREKQLPTTNPAWQMTTTKLSVHVVVSILTGEWQANYVSRIHKTWANLEVRVSEWSIFPDTTTWLVRSSIVLHAHPPIAHFCVNFYR